MAGMFTKLQKLRDQEQAAAPSPTRPRTSAARLKPDQTVVSIPPASEPEQLASPVRTQSPSPSPGLPTAPRADDPPPAAPPDLLAGFDLAEFPDRKATFPISSREFWAFENLKVYLAQRSDDPRLKKEDIYRAILQELLEDYQRHGDESTTMQTLSRRLLNRPR